jgi:hypothetical protein
MTEKPRFIIEYPIPISLGEKVLPFQGTQEYLRPMPIAEPNNELLWKALRYKGMDGFVKATAVDVFQSGWKEIKNAEMPLGPVNISAIADNNGAYIQETPLILGMGFNVSNMVQLMDIRMLECEIVVRDKKYYLNWNDAEDILEISKRLRVGQNGYLSRELKTDQGNTVLLPLDLSKLSEQVSIEVVPAMEAFIKKFGKLFLPETLH